MRPQPLAVLFFLTVLTTGCGGPTGGPLTAKGTTSGPHGGRAVPLPDEKGYAEVVVERDKTTSPRRVSTNVRIAVYFLTPDLKGSLSPIPSEVSVKAIPPEGEPMTVALSHVPASGDSTGQSRFLSLPGKFDYDELHGDVTANIDGQPITQPFAFR